MKKRCELCTHTARIYCESDQASLCYGCDRNIHSANFLVAKHSRSLLCHQCQSPTAWIASGLDLGRAASLCVNCLREDSILEGQSRRLENDVVEENCIVHDDLHEDGDGETDDDDGEYSDEDEEDDGENQVVPWTSTASPPTTASSSTSEEFSSSGCFSSSVKRKHFDINFDSEDETVYSSERFNGEARRVIDEDLSDRVR